MFISKAYNYIKSCVNNKRALPKYAVTVVLLFVIAIVSATSVTDSTVSTMRFSEMYMVIACLLIAQKNIGEPELRSVLPVSNTRRTAYDFIIPLVMAIFILILWVLLIVIATILFGLFAWMLSGENPFVYEASESVDLPILWGQLALLFRFIAVYSLFQIIAHAGENWWKWLIATAVIILVWTVVPKFAAQSGGIFYTFYDSFGVMPLAWLFVLITAIISLALLAYSVVYVHRTNKPKDY